MGLENFYRRVMDLNMMEDSPDKEQAARELFEDLNHTQLPEHFNWAADIFEGLHVRQHPDKPGLVWADLESGREARFSFGQMARRSNQALNYLRKYGVQKGDNVYMMIPIVPETWFASLACVKGGLIIVPTATTMTARELQFRFEAYAPDVIIADEASAEIVETALKNSGSQPKVNILLGHREGWNDYAASENEADTAEPAQTRADDLSFCFFTSGTTGLPKRVGHTMVSYPVGHLSTSVMIGLRPADVHHNLSAPGWAKWGWSSFFGPLNVGATATGFYFTTLDAEKYLKAVCKYGVTTFCAPPTAWRMFIGQDLEKFDFSALRQSVSAGEPLNPEVIQQWQKATGTEIRDFYGQTESTAMIGNPPWMTGKMKAGSFGRPSFMYDMAILDDDGNEVRQPDEPGHIVVRLNRWRALGLFKEYIGSPEKMKDVFDNDCYFTGDRAYIDEDGYWWFYGRADDVIKSSDYRVGPFEVESALVEHPAVTEAAVVGVPDPERYQLVKAYVILAPGHEASRELALDLFKHTIEVLPKFKIPRIIEFVPEVPKTISGKIRRVELRENETKRSEQGTGRNPNEFFYRDFPELSSRRK